MISYGFDESYKKSFEYVTVKNLIKVGDLFWLLISSDSNLLLFISETALKDVEIQGKNWLYTR